MLTRDSILDAQDLKRETVKVPEWGGSVTLQELPAAEAEKFWTSATGTPKNLRATLVAKSAIDKDGNRLFEDKDAEVLGKKSNAVIQRLFEAASRLSGISDEELDDAAKN